MRLLLSAKSAVRRQKAHLGNCTTHLMVLQTGRVREQSVLQLLVRLAPAREHSSRQSAAPRESAARPQRGNAPSRWSAGEPSSSFLSSHVISTSQCLPWPQSAYYCQPGTANSCKGPIDADRARTSSLQIYPQAAHPALLKLQLAVQLRKVLRRRCVFCVAVKQRRRTSPQTRQMQLLRHTRLRSRRLLPLRLKLTSASRCCRCAGLFAKLPAVLAFCYECTYSIRFEQFLQW